MLLTFSITYLCFSSDNFFISGAVAAYNAHKLYAHYNRAQLSQKRDADADYPAEYDTYGYSPLSDHIYYVARACRDKRGSVRALCQRRDRHRRSA